MTRDAFPSGKDTEWREEWGEMPDITLEIRPTTVPGSAERHLRMLEMLFGPITPAAEKTDRSRDGNFSDSSESDG